MTKNSNLLYKISIALLLLNGCSKQSDVTDIEYKKRMFQFHYVHVGESLDSIANFYGMTRQELIVNNQLRFPYQLTKNQRLHVHKRKFWDREEIDEGYSEFSKVPNRLLDPYVPYSAVKKVQHPTVIKRTGLKKIFVPVVAAYSALAAFKPKVAFATTNAVQKSPDSSITESSDLGLNTAPIIRPVSNPKNKQTVNVLRNTAMPLLTLATGGVGSGLGAAFLMNAFDKVTHKNKGQMRKSVPAQTVCNMCSARPCFTWPINDQYRKFKEDKKNQRIEILNTSCEKFVRPAAFGKIDKIYVPNTIANLNMYTVIIDHNVPPCYSTFKTVYSGLSRVSDAIKVGRIVNRDIIIGEIKPCCDKSLLFQIQDASKPVKNTVKYLPR